MATQTVQPIRAASGRTATAKLFTFGNDTAVQSVAATEATNRKGTYLAAFTDAPAGEYEVILIDDVTGVNLSHCWVTLALATGNYDTYTRVDKPGITTNNWAALTVDHTSTGSFGYVVGLFFQLIENVTGWRFTAKALEQVSGPDVYVYPMSMEQEPRNTHAKITVYTGETGSQYFFAYDSAGIALSLTGKTLEFRVADTKSQQRLYTAKTSDGTLTISLGNKVTFTKSTKFTRFANTDVTYSLRDMDAGGEVLLDGQIELMWAP